MAGLILTAFRYAYYLDCYPDVAESGMNALSISSSAGG